MARDLKSMSKQLAMVQAAVLAATNAGTTAVDLGTSRDAMVIISTTSGSDVASAITLQHSSDNSTFTTHTTITTADLAATGIDIYTLTDVKRYLRIAWTRSASAADSYWSVVAIGINEYDTSV